MNLAQHFNRFYNDLRMPDVNRIGTALAIEWLDEAERVINKRSKSIHASQVTASVAGQRLYDYPTDILDYTIDNVYYSDTTSVERFKLEPVTITELDERIPQWLDNDGFCPSYWYHDKAVGQWGLYSWENAVTTGTDCIQVRYRKKHTKMTRYYTTGTVTMTNGSDAVVGAGTTFTGNVQVGDQIGVGKLLDVDTAFPVTWYTVESVDSNTGITLTGNFAESTVAGASYIACSNSSIENDELNSCSVLWAMGLAYRFDLKFQLMQLVQTEAITRCFEEKMISEEEAAGLRRGVPFGQLPLRPNVGDYGRRR